jgi:hypothetical protein
MNKRNKGTLLVQNIIQITVDRTPTEFSTDVTVIYFNIIYRLNLPVIRQSLFPSLITTYRSC